MRKAVIWVLILIFLTGFVNVAAGSDPKIKFIASIKSNRYHYPWCKRAKRIKQEYLIVFDSPEQAREENYIPCKICKPSR